MCRFLSNAQKPGLKFVGRTRLLKPPNRVHITDFNKMSIKCNKAGLKALQIMTDEQVLAVPHEEWLNFNGGGSCKKISCVSE